MNLQDRIKAYEGYAKILETVAGRYEESSDEYLVVRRAAIALWYVLTEDHERFSSYLNNFDGDLTRAQRSHLRSMGIDPDVDPKA